MVTLQSGSTPQQLQLEKLQNRSSFAFLHIASVAPSFFLSVHIYKLDESNLLSPIAQ
jgi:hypothetical protein